MKIGYKKPLYILPFDHRSSFEKGLFGWTGALSNEQVEKIAQSKEVIYDGFRHAYSEPGFIGFAVGRTTFWDSLVALRDSKISPQQAVEDIADRYMNWVQVFTAAK